MKTKNLPVWLLIHLVACKTRSPVEANEAAKFVFRHSSKVDPVAKSALMILTTRVLAKYQVSSPMEVIVTFLQGTPLENPQLHYNYLLMAMSHFRMTPNLGKLIASLLQTMKGRQISLEHRTFSMLISNRIVTLELAKKLQQEGPHASRWNLQEMEAYLRLFAKNGAVHMSARFLNLIREKRLQGRKEAPYGVELSKGAKVNLSGDGTPLRWNTEFLTTFNRHSGSAFYYLRSLLAADQLQEPKRAPRKIVRFWNRTAVWKRGIHVSDWTTVLQAAGRDENLDSKQLLSLLARIRATTGMQVTIAVITVVMRGLVRKGDYTTAYRIWTVWLKVSNRKRIMDSKSLTIAMAVLVRAGHPLEAWDTLISATGILTNAPKITVPKRKRMQSPVRADAALVNSLMSAFLKSGRTDMVFKLWEAFTPLFGIYQDNVTITLLLRAAREAARFDRTFRGLFEQMGLHGIFQKKKAWPDYKTKTKEEIAKSLRSIIYRGLPKDQDNQAPEVAGIRKALWNDELAGPKVNRMFKEILIGSQPNLRYIMAPAVAIWPDNAQAGHPIRDALRAVGLTRVHESIDKRTPAHEDSPPGSPLLVGPTLLQPPTLSSLPPPEVPTYINALLKPEHPQIVPDATAFGAYIELLGGLGRGSEIAQTLAWMRALNVHPSRRTLALALVLWSEMSMRGPLLERYGGVSEYEKLYRWLVSWLEHEGMPTEGMMGWAFRYWKREREK